MIHRGIDDDVDHTHQTALSSSKSREVLYFEPAHLRNLVQIDEMESLCPILDFKVGQCRSFAR